LPQEHVVWVMTRLLSVLGYMHNTSVIHGSIEPANCMIIPKNHNGLLIDMVYSVSHANKPGSSYIGTNLYTAPEIISKDMLEPHPSSDMFSLGKTMLYLLGGDVNTNAFPENVDPRLKTFLEAYLDEDPYRRKNDAWKSWHELQDLRVQVFGSIHQFLPLTIGQPEERKS